MEKKWIVCISYLCLSALIGHAVAQDAKPQAATAPGNAAGAWRPHVIDGGSKGADGVRIMDANGDGAMDIVTGWEEGGLIRVYLNPRARGAKEAWPAVTVGKVARPEDAVFADVDGNGAIDVVSATEGKERSIYVHWAPVDKEQYADASAWKAEAIAVTAQSAASGAGWMFVLPMQIDGQGGIDLVIGSKGEGASIGWLQSPANPRDLAGWTYHKLYDAGWIMSLIAADMDFDGDLDVLASDRKGPTSGVLWLDNPGPEAAARNSKWKEHRIGPRGRAEVMFIDLADVEGDGRFDILAPVKPDAIAWFRLTAEGNWLMDTIRVVAPPDSAGVGNVKAVKATDIDTDGKLDLAVSFEGAEGDKSGLVWLQRNRRDWVIRDIAGVDGVKYDLIVPIDLDDDGDLDLVTTEERDNLGVVWYENPTRLPVEPVAPGRP